MASGKHEARGLANSRTAPADLSGAQADGARPASVAAPPPAEWLTMALEEYRALRVEIVEAIQAQRTIMQVGTTGLAVLIGFGLQRIGPLSSVLILTLLVPAVAIFTTVGALGELFRAARASCFLARQAAVLNHAFAWDVPAMEWEQWLRRRSTFSLRDRAEFFVLLSVTTGAVGLGLHTMVAARPRIGSPGVLAAITVAAAVLWVAHPILHFYLVSRARRQFLCPEAMIAPTPDGA